MTIVLTEHAHELLRKELARHPEQTPEQVIERALENLESGQAVYSSSVDRCNQAAARLRELRKGVTLAGTTLKSLVHEGHRY